MKVSLLLLGVTAVANDWITKNWADVLKLAVLGGAIILSMQDRLDRNSEQLSILQQGQNLLREKIEAVQIGATEQATKLMYVEKTLDDHHRLETNRIEHEHPEK